MPRLSDAQRAAARQKPPNYTAVMADELVRIGREDPRVVAITAGMPTGTGLSRFGAAFPDRMYRRGHRGAACGDARDRDSPSAGQRPLVALYSTFLQRAFDQVVHDVCQNDVPVVIGVDRAGLVGEDGTSHQGMFTLPAQRQLPNLVIASPRDEQQLRSLLRTAFAQDHPFALHYPRDAGFDLPDVEPAILPIGVGETLREGERPAHRGLRAHRHARPGGRRRGWSARGLVGGCHRCPVRQAARRAAHHGRGAVASSSS